MLRSFRALCTNPASYWCIALLSIAVWSFIPSYRIGWDFTNFKAAILALRGGHDPYASALAAQQAFRAHAHPAGIDAPLSYVYSPMTLPLMRLVGLLPLGLSGTLYWLLYALAFGVIVWAGMQWADDDERKVFLYLAPFAVFFPGLLQSDVIFSGNIAILLYACVLATAVRGWRADKWGAFYAAVLMASCFKAPMLSLLAIPALSCRKQWLPTFVAAVSGVTLFLMQPLIWPSEFGNFMKVLDYMFRVEHDFSSSPSGVLTEQISTVMTYKSTLTSVYLVYAVPMSCVLLYLAYRYFSGRLTLKQWGPVMMMGVVLLNPRIIEYDVTAITLPMALVVWRALSVNSSQRATITKMAALFLTANLLSIVPTPALHLAWRWTEAALLMSVFAGGAIALHLQSRVPSYAAESYLEDVVFEEGLAEEMAL